MHRDRPAVSVVIPVFNERATIEEILCRVQAVEGGEGNYHRRRWFDRWDLVIFLPN